ncbi:hypothetical protein P7K49_039848, partial [Saguinus oedipus]
MRMVMVTKTLSGDVQSVDACQGCTAHCADWIPINGHPVVGAIAGVPLPKVESYSSNNLAAAQWMESLSVCGDCAWQRVQVTQNFHLMFCSCISRAPAIPHLLQEPFEWHLPQQSRSLHGGFPDCASSTDHQNLLCSCQCHPQPYLAGCQATP